MKDYFWYCCSILFRYFPLRYPPGIVALGHPDKNSLVLISGNYFLTVFKLKRILKNLNCYILVVDSAGVNVWCAAGAGDFNENKVVDAIFTYKLDELVSHRRVILPQLAAVGVDLQILRQRSGFNGEWGPASFYDLPEYLAQDKRSISERMHILRMPFFDRMELAIGMVGTYFLSYLKYYIIFALFLGMQYNHDVFLITIAYTITILLTPFLDFLPFKWATNNLMVISIPSYFFLWWYVESYPAFIHMLPIYLLANSVFTILICMDILGSTIHFKSSVANWLCTFNNKSYFGPKLVSERCTKCHACQNICPKGIIGEEDNGYPSFQLELECCECLACVKQCQALAILNINAPKFKGDIKSIPQEQLAQVMGEKYY
ncbi:MAG: hypothetical protein A2504_13575 [Bdellovibrionales bacterium RIFOXYD12_FULL_39_22]|nr:MAG: hypothetical protein A2385_00300 [Bdellovibrionales bacterium RIFOXYB1_FULL_39_21]OFZ43882.1 MAG: hypothetical protein A2485_05230 [Bdellovibrionales bacterium RIFOXYC12_FULL_39_17]OFZ48784.1 MAG: hypothetical protein A2404_17615 [Bdellovibrionales bacterium RIFOXYC1_FULL_39_130]OFZ76517.1 MAG: hypothetical protein A2560_06280 [Bdellovibrionales bacterium RIFOXYD1_FULL_39_84]OFZ94751.1 MAG: hypothetical protein A2504_13575 [Bdellovibrionales bacterium RIFOXYD12_FULL_39_22]HLE12174.1 Hg